jgi:hypothetical protein
MMVESNAVYECGVTRGQERSDTSDQDMQTNKTINQAANWAGY